MKKTTHNPENTEPAHRMLPCRAWLSSILFSDGTILELKPDDTVVLVGANNSGKSETLRSISAIAQTGNADSPIVSEIRVGTSGTAEQLVEWVTSNLAKRGAFPNHSYEGYGAGIGISTIQHYWPQGGLGPLAPLFIHTCRTQSRISDSDSPSSIGRNEAKSHPLHRLYDDDKLEERISRIFHEAFNVDLVINWRGGNQMPVHVGQTPV